MSPKNKDVKSRRKRNYDRLIAVGYNSREANRFKDFSEKNILLAIELRENFNSKIKTIGGK